MIHGSKRAFALVLPYVAHASRSQGRVSRNTEYSPRLSQSQRPPPTDSPAGKMAGLDLGAKYERPGGSPHHQFEQRWVPLPFAGTAQAGRNRGLYAHDPRNLDPAWRSTPRPRVPGPHSSPRTAQRRWGFWHRLPYREFPHCDRLAAERLSRVLLEPYNAAACFP
jgi:hypothetical protein